MPVIYNLIFILSSRFIYVTLWIYYWSTELSAYIEKPFSSVDFSTNTNEQTTDLLNIQDPINLIEKNKVNIDEV